MTATARKTTAWGETVCPKCGGIGPTSCICPTSVPESEHPLTTDLPARPTKAGFDVLDLVATGDVRFIVHNFGLRAGRGHYYAPGQSGPWGRAFPMRRTFDTARAAGLITHPDSSASQEVTVELTDAGRYARSMRWKVFTTQHLYLPAPLRLVLGAGAHGETDGRAFIVAANAAAADDMIRTRGMKRDGGEIRLAPPGHYLADLLRYSGLIAASPRMLICRGYAGRTPVPVLDVRLDQDTPLVGWFNVDPDRTPGASTFKLADR